MRAHAHAGDGTAYSYDSNGNLVSDGSSTYTWNSRNQLAAISGANSASFSYDGLGRRRARTVGGTTTQYLYDGQNPIQELAGGSATANLLAGPQLDEWYGRTNGGASLAYVTDALGSTRALADASQVLATSYTYEPYGKTSVTGAATTNSLAYTGRENDGTGLYYYRARYYSPSAGRFVSEDPIGLAGGDNLYTYVGGSPLKYSDRAGLCPWCIVGGIIGGVTNATAQYYANGGSFSNFDPWSLGFAVASGAIGGGAGSAIYSATTSLGWNALGGMATGFWTSYASTAALNKINGTCNDPLTAGGWGGLAGFAGGGAGAWAGNLATRFGANVNNWVNGTVLPTMLPSSVPYQTQSIGNGFAATGNAVGNAAGNTVANMNNFVP